MMSDKTGLAKLREPFPDSDVSWLPKQLKREDQDRGKCEAGSAYSADGRYCGGYHARSIHLDYVGHAALTKRLLEADESWNWEPMGVSDNGLPVLDQNGGLWIRLTVCGVTRPGYGDAQGKSGGNAVKEAIGDALRNSAMRFGAALGLWHKGQLSDFMEDPPEGWQDLVDEAETPQALVDLYNLDAKRWYTPEVHQAFQARRAELTGVSTAKARVQKAAGGAVRRSDASTSRTPTGTPGKRGRPSDQATATPRPESGPPSITCERCKRDHQVPGPNYIGLCVDCDAEVTKEAEQ
jgi:hypothetical protein